MTLSKSGTGVANQGRGPSVVSVVLVGERRGLNAGPWTPESARDSSPRVLSISSDTGGSLRA